MSCIESTGQFITVQIRFTLVGVTFKVVFFRSQRSIWRSIYTFYFDPHSLSLSLSLSFSLSIYLSSPLSQILSPSLFLSLSLSFFLSVKHAPVSCYQALQKSISFAIKATAYTLLLPTWTKNFSLKTLSSSNLSWIGRAENLSWK